MKNFLKNVISILLTQESGNNFSTSVYKFKNKHAWIFKLIYGSASDADILNNIFQKLLDGKFDILMIHSSINNMIPVYTGNINEFLHKILSYCENNNVTLIMPTFFNGTNTQAIEYYKNEKQIFDVNKTFSGSGFITELFRRHPKVKRSIHPTHSICALGPLADNIIRKHHLSDTSFGQGTPFYEIIKYRTIILGIGIKSHQTLTQVHSAEDIMKIQFPITLYSGVLPITCLDESGVALIYNLHLRNPEYVLDLKSFHKILNGKILSEWTFKGIPFYLTKANVVTETLIEAARNGQTIYKKRK